MRAFLFPLILICLAVPARVQASEPDWDDPESEADALPVSRELTYETFGRSSGFRSHKWLLSLAQKKGMKTGVYLIRDEYTTSPIESHMLGFYGSRNFRRVGVRGSYALKDKSLAGPQGKNFVSGGLRVSPFPNLDLVADYDRIQDEYLTGEDDSERETFSAGFSLRAAKAFRMKVVYSGENRMRAKVSYRW